MGILSMISGAANPYMLYIKIGIVVVLALLIGSLYWYGKHEADKVTDLTKQNGAQAQVIADESKTIDAYKSANQKWADALKKYQTDAQAQNDALASAEQQEERINARLKDLEARLRSDPHGSAVRLNRDNDELVCMLQRASGGSSVGCPGVAPAAPAAPASSAP